MKITLVPYDPAWPARYEMHRERIERALGANARSIDHIGSTAVPELAAKPIVDIMIRVDDVTSPFVQSALTDAGYALVVDEDAHRMFRSSEAAAHVHLWSRDADIERHRLFRDRLRADEGDRALYEHVKRVFSQREWAEQNDYAQAKTAVVDGILRRARGNDRGPRVEQFAQTVGRFIPTGARILEIGAGEGELAARLADSGHDVIAIDRALRSHYPIVETSFEEYEAPAQSFDAVVAQLFLHHAHDLNATLERIVKLLRPGGTVAIDDYGWERSDDAAFRDERSDLHRSDDMLRALRERFQELYYADHAYFDDGAGSDLLAFTFIGRKRDA